MVLVGTGLLVIAGAWLFLTRRASLWTRLAAYVVGGVAGVVGLLLVAAGSTSTLSTPVSQTPSIGLSTPGQPFGSTAPTQTSAVVTTSEWGTVDGNPSAYVGDQAQVSGQIVQLIPDTNGVQQYRAYVGNSGNSNEAVLDYVGTFPSLP